MEVPAESPERRRLIDLSHQISHGMVTYPGLPGPEISDYLSREASPARYGPGTEFHIGRISMVANTGTYIDSPFHRFAAGTDMAGLPLQSVADLDGVVVRVHAGPPAIDLDVLSGHDVRGRAVLVHTGWDRYWGTERYGRIIPSSPLPRPSGWSSNRPDWLASTRSTSTTPAAGRARCTPHCWRPAFRSWSTCAGSSSSRRTAFASMPPPLRSSGSAASRFAPMPSCPLGRL
jgi:kynurenine formamidase